MLLEKDVSVPPTDTDGTTAAPILFTRPGEEHGW
jgi:hypothetical protein